MKDYFIGLDIGTNSVGYCVTDENYNILSHKNEKLWGSVLFNESETNAERRMYRQRRRQIKRKRERILYLRSLFEEEINKIDPLFFKRLDQSKYLLEDREIKTKATLFETSDKEYFKAFPTIYHLRKTLVDGNFKNVDIRHFYLAISHIVKSRGHFLYSGELNDIKTLKENITDLFHNQNIEISDSQAEEIEKIVKDKRKNKKEKVKLLSSLFEKNDKIKAMFGLIIGSKVKLKNLFPDIDLENEKTSISLDSDYDVLRAEIYPILGDDITLIDDAKKVFDSLILIDIKPEGMTISQAKIMSFEKHKKDLKMLKKVLKPILDNDPLSTQFFAFFNDENTSNINYVNYTRSTIGSNKIAKSDFYATIKKLVKESSLAEKDIILEEIENDRFLPLQRSKDNSVIPYQVHENELKAILEKAKEKFPFFTDETNDKIIKVFQYRIPYYVGPLHKNAKNGWMVRKEEGKITPWNFKEKIDINASAEKFIDRLINNCTYLMDEKVLAKNSPAYSRFMMLNILNSICIDSIEKIPNHLKLEIMNQLENQPISLSKSYIKKFLIANGFDKNIKISGLDSNMKVNTKSIREIKTILGDDFSEKAAENIVKIITIYPNEKEMVKDKISKSMPFIKKEQLEKIANLKYEGWGKLSHAFLYDIYADVDGEEMNIIEAMTKKELNLMQLLSNSYEFKSKIDELNSEKLNTKYNVDISNDMLDELNLPPYIRRSMWQTTKIVKSIIKKMKKNPSKIFVETIRRKEESSISKSRKERLLELYSSISNEEITYEDIEALNNQDLENKAIYLYYLQLGRCMYSGEKIDIEQIKKNKYNVDHIYPKSKTNDDSFNNIVLVKTETNLEKSNVFPIRPEIQNKMKPFWNKLLDLKLLTQEKYKRLVRTKDFDDLELSNFINRQIVQTAWSSIAIAKLLEKVYPESKIIYVKAENVTKFRQKNKKIKGYIKTRSINNMHHAKDAYLNIVVGNVYHEKFTNNPLNFIKKERNDNNSEFVKKQLEGYNLDKIMERPLTRHNKTIWSDSHKEIVDKNMAKNDVKITKKLKIQDSGFFNETVYGKNVTNEKSYFPLKSSDEKLKDVTKYGGKSSIKIAYYSIIEATLITSLKSKEKEEIFDYLIPIPTLKIKEIERDEKVLEDVIFDFLKSNIEKKQKVKNIKIINKKVPLNSIIKVNNVKLYVGGKSDTRFSISHVKPLILDFETEKTIYNIEKYMNTRKEYLLNHGGLNDAFSKIIQKTNSYPFIPEKKKEELNSEKLKNQFRDLSLDKKAESILEILKYMNGISANAKHLSISLTPLRISLKFEKKSNMHLVRQ